MKKIGFIVYILLAVVLTSCSKKIVLGEDVVSAQNSAVSAQGIAHVKSWIYTERKWSSVKDDALKNAIEKVLFLGIPNSKLKRPLITDPRARENYASYFEEFFKDGGRFKQFGQALSVDSSDRIRKGKGMRVGVDCKIYYKQLRDELVSQGIMQKFGI